MTTNTKERTSLVNKFLNGVEKAGNKLPDPAMLFFLMCWLSRYHLILSLLTYQ